jgi:hypothetical protein
VQEYTRRRRPPPNTRTKTRERWQPFLLLSTTAAVAVATTAVEGRKGVQAANVVHDTQGLSEQRRPSVRRLIGSQSSPYSVLSVFLNLL